MKRILILLITMIALWSCKEDQSNQSEQLEAVDYIKYAKGLSIQKGEGYTLVDMTDPANENEQIWKYALVPRGTQPEGIPSDYVVIETPVRRAIVDPFERIQKKAFAMSGDITICGARAGSQNPD